MKKQKQHHKSGEEIKREHEIEVHKQEYERKKKIVADEVLSKLRELSIQDFLTFVDVCMQSINRGYQEFATNKNLSELDLLAQIKPDAPHKDEYMSVLCALKDEKINSALTILNLAKQDIDVKIGTLLEKKLSEI